MYWYLLVELGLNGLDALICWYVLVCSILHTLCICYYVLVSIGKEKIMKYVKRTITLPEDLNKQAGAEKNTSAVVAEALKKHYTNKNATRELVRVTISLEQTLRDIERGLAKLEVRTKRIVELLEGAGQSY